MGGRPYQTLVCLLTGVGSVGGAFLSMPLVGNASSDTPTSSPVHRRDAGATADENGRATSTDAFVGTALLSFEYRAEPAMRMPTAVAVTSDGSVFVADGVNDRIIQFDASAKPVGEIRAVGGENLSHPLSLKSDDAGRLWIADTGNARVLVRAPDGSLQHKIVVEKGSAQHEPDVTDLAIEHVTGETPVPRAAHHGEHGDHGELNYPSLSVHSVHSVVNAPQATGETPVPRLWVVDNENHRLGRWDAATKTWSFFGTQGESAGQFLYPFMLTLGKGGDVLVSEVLNARVQVLSDQGAPVGRMGSYGVDLGQFYRPKGLACDAQGQVWVADSVLGIIQVFAAEGGFLDGLRDGAGKLIRFEAPVGISFDDPGDLYVAELAANRVRKFRIASHHPAVAPPASPQPSAAERRQGRACTVCHLEWMPPFPDGHGTSILDPPSSPPQDPLVSRSDTCLSCHDGSVVDSRRRVWQEHGHRTGVKPPESMRVPPTLPLVEGAIACRTCHSAHAGGKTTGDIAGAMFLRLPNRASELCISCHADKTRGPKLGSHPIGGMPWPVPQTLLEAGASAGPNLREITCQVCHAPHGAASDHLLVMDTNSNQLCLTCHEQMRPGMFREGGDAEHPISPKAGPEQVAAIQQLGTRLGPDNRLLCLSCHKMHEGQGERFMLADELTDGQMCLRCHSDRDSVLGTAHDLRARFPEELNRLGMTAHTGGPCSSCHLFHRYARPPETSPIDPGGGKCITCHQEGRCAQAKSLGPITHPGAKCGACHDPHDAENENFLRQPPAQLCGECHDHGDKMVGPHTFESRPESVNARGQKVADVGACLVCHSVHHGVAKPLWGASLTPLKDDREKCTVCHRLGGLAEGKATKALNHTLACTSCHNPHGDSEANPALLVEEGPAENLCARCHEDNLALAGGPHDFKGNLGAWPAVSVQTGDRCLACHRPHSDEQAALFRNGRAEGLTGPDAACLACHPQSGWGVHSDIAALHPRSGASIANAGDLPLVPGGVAPPPEASGAVLGPVEPPSAQGGMGVSPVADQSEPTSQALRIGCRTCHNPHRGKGPPPKLVRAEDDEPAVVLCLQCHQQKQQIEQTPHGRLRTNVEQASPPAATSPPAESNNLPEVSCLPCHALHGSPTAAGQLLLGLPHASAKSADAIALPAEQRCLGCHRAEGQARAPAIATHPDVLLRNTIAADSPGFWPLFNERGEVDPYGRISCPTCHLPHGRLAEPGGPPASELPAGHPNAAWFLVRPYTTPNVCNTCHGPDAIRRFLYFHNPSQRKGPLSVAQPRPPV